MMSSFWSNPKPVAFGSTTSEAQPMKSDRSFHGKGRPWVPPTVTRLAIGTETKSSVAVDQGITPGLGGPGAIKNAEPQPATTPAMKFGFSVEWSFPLSARTD
jgi:hypothetical protein